MDVRSRRRPAFLESVVPHSEASAIRVESEEHDGDQLVAPPLDGRRLVDRLELHEVLTRGRARSIGCASVLSSEPHQLETLVVRAGHGDCRSVEDRWTVLPRATTSSRERAKTLANAAPLERAKGLQIV